MHFQKEIQMSKLKEQDRYESIRLENQLCFPLYASSKEIIRKYRLPLEKLNLTYTQYIVMMVLWEFGGMTERIMELKRLLDKAVMKMEA